MSLIGLLLLSFVCQLSHSTSLKANSNEIQITSVQHFDELMQNPGDVKLFVMKFYFDSCYWCKQLEPTWNQLVESFCESEYSTSITFLKINGPQLKELANRFNVNGYPTLITKCPQVNGLTYTYTGQRDFNPLHDWIVGKYRQGI